MGMKEGIKKNGTLKKGYKYKRGGGVVKSNSKSVTPSLFSGTVLKPKKKYAKGSKSNKKLDAKRKALKPGKRLSKKGNIYYESRKNRSDLK